MAIKEQDCLDIFTDLKRDSIANKSMGETYRKTQWHKGIVLKLQPSEEGGENTNFEFHTRDLEVNRVVYVDSSRKIPRKLEDEELAKTLKRLLTNGKNCNEMSGSDIYRKGD